MSLEKAMTLPIRSAFQNDATVLNQAVEKLDEARRAFKKLSKVPSVAEDTAMHEAVDALRARLKKLSKRTRSFQGEWTEKARASE
ncbi:hypothetical protein [Bradyrhizobium elkanii]|uniref:hypothetical protein n=1 Tax=Bradyrhizobium elkanii TaxID=29448 RepID=UPI001AE8B1D8|nr:hypothetical protein [Bradyrhizobium elkanii]MBP2434036.1 ubiquinone biosynthesis protein UbiJ [Bradyrhizobium elkanii]WLA89026.1 hypothetical protein QNJ96_28545 [Bradyrhizobium elkanii]